MSTASTTSLTTPAVAKSETIDLAERLVAAKALGEFSHERLFEPKPVTDHLKLVSENPSAGATPSKAQTQQTTGPRACAADKESQWKVHLSNGVTYEFTAHTLPLNHWIVDPQSIKRSPASADGTISAAQLIVDAQAELNVPDALRGPYLTEVNATVTARAESLATQDIPAAELVNATQTRREAALALGHPCFVATNGRIGFGSSDLTIYPPEATTGFRPLWVAVKKDLCEFNLDYTIIDDYEDLIPSHVATTWVEAARHGQITADDYQLIPVHPWQWDNIITVMFGPQIAKQEIVCVCEDPDIHRAQQSIRTLLSDTTPGRPYVKTSLSIRNMGFVRGMSPTYVRAAPAICAWVYEQLNNDPYLAHVRFRILREFASAGYIGDIFHQAVPGTPETKVMAALWRENPQSLITDEESLCSMATLLHQDALGTAFVAELIKASQLTPVEWLSEFLKTYLVPLVHVLVQHRMAFMPHGENIILVLNNHVPVGVFLKDIAEEVIVADVDATVPENAERIKQQLSDSDLAQCVHTDIIDGFLRHVAGLLDSSGVLPWDEFWDCATAILQDYESDNPECKRLELFAPEVPLSCLNRLQLRDTTMMVDLTQPVESLMYAGVVENPLHLSQPGQVTNPAKDTP